MQLMEETHRLTVQQMVVAHNSELENLASRIRELQHELQTKSVSVFLALCLVCCSVSHAKKKIRKCGQCSYFAICIWMDAWEITWNRRFLGDSWCAIVQTSADFNDLLQYTLVIPPHTHPFNGPFSGTTQVSRYQKGKTNLDFTEARDSEWQWHQLGHMQVCISLQTDNHASTPPLSFLQAGCPSCCPTNSVKALQAKHWRHIP